MQGHHRARERLRPRHRPTAVHARGDWQDQANGTPARLFLCRGCRVQVLICSHCDRGHVYCAEACAQKARRQSQRESGRRYQMSRRGRINHAARARRYRARKNNVTHQGSAPDRSDDLLREDQAVAMAEQSARDSSSRPRWRCHRCGRHCSPLVRHDFLQRCRDPWSNRRRHEGNMAKRGAKRRQCREASVLDRVPDHSKASLGAGLPRAIPLPIPTYWTPEQAIAVFELVDDLRERIWAFYQADLQELTRQQRQPEPVDPIEIDEGDLPF
jgi:hypothetical protein